MWLKALLKRALSIPFMGALLFKRATISIDLSSLLKRNGRSIIQVGPLLVVKMLGPIGLFLVERPHAQVDPNVLVLWALASVEQASVRGGFTHPLGHQLTRCVHGTVNHGRTPRLLDYHIIKWFQALILNRGLGTRLSVPQLCKVLLFIEVRGERDRLRASHLLQRRMLRAQLWSSGLVIADWVQGRTRLLFYKSTCTVQIFNTKVFTAHLC